MKILVTGASGFVGSALITKLAQSPEYSVRAAVRKSTCARSGVEYKVVPELSEKAKWVEALEGVNVVVHLAARVHVLRDVVEDPLAEFRRVNVEGTRALAEQAARANVQRFVYVSSIKVNGEETNFGRPFRSGDPPYPLDHYGVSKLDAERVLQEVCESSRMQYVIVRPPLVYGPAVKANFRTMMSWVYRGIPLPFGRVTENRRSLIALENLVHLLCTTLAHPRAGNRVFLASDGDDLSTADLLRRLGVALGSPARLFPLSPRALQAAASLLGRADLARRLLGSLQVDISETCDVLDWKPPVKVDVALAETARDYLAREEK